MKTEIVVFEYNISRELVFIKTLLIWIDYLHLSTPVMLVCENYDQKLTRYFFNIYHFVDV